MGLKLEAIVVLGAGFEDKKPSKIALDRLKKAVEIAESYPEAKLILSGKHSFWLENPPNLTEARVMSDYLEANGIPKERLILEEHSTDTIGNAYFVKKILELYGWKHVAIITSDFHMGRAKYLFKHILGKGYKLKFIPAKSSIKKEELKKLKIEERKILRLTKRFLKHVKDEKSLEEFMFKKHPGYAEAPEISKQELLKLIELEPSRPILELILKFIKKLFKF